MLRGRQLQSRKKGGAGVGKTKRGKGVKVMAVADRSGLPVAVCAGGASPHETKFVLELIGSCATAGRPERLIGDKAYDSNPLDAECAGLGVDLIAPHRAGRRKRRTQDGRSLRRYARRWKVERLFAWLQNYRRLITKFERKIENFLAFLRLASFMILAKKYL